MLPISNPKFHFEIQHINNYNTKKISFGKIRRFSKKIGKSNENKKKITHNKLFRVIWTHPQCGWQCGQRWI